MGHSVYTRIYAQMNNGPVFLLAVYTYTHQYITEILINSTVQTYVVISNRNVNMSASSACCQSDDLHKLVTETCD